MSRTAVAGLLPEELEEQLGLTPRFRAMQIFSWIARGAESFEQMTDLSKDLRAELSQKAELRSATLGQRLTDPDGTLKLQLTLRDGLAIEAVLLTDAAGRKTACLSCQAGCAMGCAFCMTGTLGLARSLSAAEIVEEFLMLEKEAGRLDNIVFMGMGEPMMNLAAVRSAVSVLCHKKGRGLSARRITLSTCGVVPGIYDLADNGPPLRLAVSLTTADTALRQELMPVAKAYPLEELRQAISYYAEKTSQRATLEAALLGGVNTGRQSAERMLAFAEGLNVHINLIPWNPVASLPFSEPSAAECKRFVHWLEQAGLSVSLRTRRGRAIGGACGQLGRTAQQEVISGPAPSPR